MAYRILTNGGVGTGVNPYGKDYPFVAPGSDLRGLFSDLWLCHDQDVALPLRVVWLYGFARYLEDPLPSPVAAEGPYTPENATDLVIVDADDVVVFDSTAADYAATDFGDRLRVHEWQTATAVCRVVQHTAFRKASDVVEFEQEIEPENGELHSRTWARMPERIRSIRVSDDNYLTGGIVLRNGWNTLLNALPSQAFKARGGHRLEISAAPGSGLGRFPDCEEPSPLLRRINGVAADQWGNLDLSATGCYYVRQPTEVVDESPRVVDVTPNTLRIGNDCGVCCECDDYINVYTALRRLHTRYRTMGQTIEQMRRTHAANVARWTANAACRQGTVLRVATIPLGVDFMDVAASICNNSPTCLYDVEVTLAVTVNNPQQPTIPAPGSCTTFASNAQGQTLPYELAQTEEGFVSFWDVLEPGAAGRIRFRLEFLNDAGQSAGFEGMSVSICATAKAGGSPILFEGDPIETCSTAVLAAC